jgi:tRNA nucleotidyltransferase (CCA-adding enzyme)
MEVYLVGGAVRDHLLGLPVGERDWVVVGAHPEEMQRQGYMLVGKEFPVFLHPETREEYALARTERKTGPGYRGFTTRFSPDVTLEDDLKRRDLTINAIAEDAEGELVDPFGGQRDIEARVLRHVSEAFVEDPVRVLRLARFAARFASLGFTVAEETRGLLKQIVAAGEMDALVPERVWKETQKALDESRPDVYFETLRDCGALKVIFPEIEALYGVPQPAQWHPEIDTGVHVMMALRFAASHGASAATRFAVLTHDLGKALTPQEKWPAHHGHEQLGVPAIEALAARLRVPKEFRDLAVMVSNYHTHVHRALQLKAGTMLELFENTDAFRRPDRFNEFLHACECDARGRLGLEERDYPQANYLREARSAGAAITLTEADRQGLTGPAIGEKLHQKRLDALAAFKSQRD